MLGIFIVVGVLLLIMLLVIFIPTDANAERKFRTGRKYGNRTYRNFNYDPHAKNKRR